MKISGGLYRCNCMVGAHFAYHDDPISNCGVEAPERQGLSAYKATRLIPGEPFGRDV